MMLLRREGGLKTNSTDLIMPHLGQQNQPNQQQQQKPKRKGKGKKKGAVIPLPPEPYRNSVPVYVEGRNPNRVHTKKAKSRLKRTAATAHLSSADTTIAMRYLANFLYPEKPMKLVRPIPVRSASYFKAGEITWESAGEYSEVQFNPDPWNFISVKREEPAATLQLTQPLNEHYPASADILATGRTQYWSFSEPIPTTTGKLVQPTWFNPSVAGEFVCTKNGHVENGVQGYQGAIPNALTASVVVTNRALVTVLCRFFCTVYNADGSQAYSSSTVTAVNCNSNADTVITLPSTTFATTSSQRTAFMLQVNNSSGVNVRINDFDFGWFSTGGTVTVASQPARTVYTLGDALYPNDELLNNQVMDVFRTCQLWSPVAMACLYNVSQVLKDAGGKFLASNLPSWTTESLNTNFEDEWTQINTLGTSYPRYFGDFQKGAQATWIGHRIEDYAFRKPYARDQILDFEHNSLPISVFMSQKASTGGEGNHFFLTFGACFEIQTFHPNFTMTLGPSSSTLMAQMLALAAASDELVGENPSHIQRLKKLAIRLYNDPLVRQGFKTLAGAGLAALF